MDYLLAAIVGVGLAAACGLRAFVPVLALALAAKAGWVGLGPGFAWLGSWPVIAGLTIATAAEITSSLTPFVAHALDAIAAPVAFAAGGLVMASQLGGSSLGGTAASLAGLPDPAQYISQVHPLLEWAAVLIAGGGLATAVHTGSASVRAGTSSVSAGLLAPVYGLLETAASLAASVLAFVVPVFFAILVGIVAAVVIAIAIALIRRHRARNGQPVSTRKPRRAGVVGAAA
ncbi:MAG: DUF4126 domain-containing protein [Phycisphaerae bacterium]|nr:DUF4126 domain-containing protein [Phycisphaerae bacterium]